MNKIIVTGNLARDPQRLSDKVLIMTMACGYEDKANFPSFRVFGKTADNCEKYLSKGSKVGIEGHVSTGKYEDKEGKTHFTQELIADRVEFLSPPKVKDEIGDFQSMEEDLPF